jgi:hypothetical protein
MRYREMRLPCETRVRLLHDGSEAPARLVNLSAAGARVAGAGPLPRDARVTLAHLGVRVAGTVVWSTPLEAGLRFSPPLPPAQVAALRRVAGSGAGWMPQGTFREL